MTDLDEKDFIRHKLFYSKKSPLSTYKALTIGNRSTMALIRYELLTMLLAPMPGAAGYFLRKVYFPSLFGNCGKNVIFGRNLTIRHPQNISIGSDVVIDDNALLDGRGAGPNNLRIGTKTIIGRNSIIQSKFGKISIGANCNLGTLSVIVSQGGIEIGDWTQIAGGCKISGGLFRPDKDSDSPFPFSRYSKGPIRIGGHCFIGGSVQITDGITIGDGSMVGTGSVVMSNIPENSIYVPKPGMVIGKTN